MVAGIERVEAEGLWVGGKRVEVLGELIQRGYEQGAG